MKLFLSLLLLLPSITFAQSETEESPRKTTVLVIPYQRAMHLSDADMDIAQGSEMDLAMMRETFRNGLLKSLNRTFAEVNDVAGVSNDFVIQSDGDESLLYHSLSFGSDTVYPKKHPSKFAVKDSLPPSVNAGKAKKESNYINVGIYDQLLLPDLARKYDNDYFLFINELDIVTHADDCLNRALKIYRRDLKVHYTIFDRQGRQIYGDVAVSHFPSNSNDVNEIMDNNFPAIANYILASYDRARKNTGVIN